MKKYCPNNHLCHDLDAKFCWKCGAKLTETCPLKCPKCGRNLAEVDSYCRRCGTKVK